MVIMALTMRGTESHARAGTFWWKASIPPSAAKSSVNFALRITGT